MATVIKNGNTYLGQLEDEKEIKAGSNDGLVTIALKKMSIDDFKVDLDVPLINPRTTQVDLELLKRIKQIPIKGSVGFSEKQQMKNFRKIMTKAFGKGSVAQRTIPAENGVQFRLWRLR